MGLASELVNDIKVCDLMSEKVILVHKNDPISIVITLFDRCKISGAPVVDENQNYIGVVSKTDLVGAKLLGLLRNHESLDNITAFDVMNTNNLTAIFKGESIAVAVDKMLNHGIHRLFVENEDGMLVGVISSFDIMKIVRHLSKVSQQDYVMITNNKGNSESATTPTDEEEEAEGMKADRKIAALIRRKQMEMSSQAK